MNPKVKYALVFSLVIFSQELMSQDFVNEYRAFRQSACQTYNDFRSKANEEYLSFMRQAWTLFYGEPPKPVPENKAPIVPPVVMPDEEKESKPEERALPFDEVIRISAPETEPSPVFTVPITPTPQPEQCQSFTFYGSNCKVRYNTTDKMYLTDIKETDVADIWKDMLAKYGMLVSDCLSIRTEMSLCDWGYVQLLKKLSDTIYDRNYRNEAVLLQAFLLNQSGFKIHLARSEEVGLHVLIAADCDLYNYPYWDLEGMHYYLLDESKVNALYVFTETYPEELPMRMRILEENRFADNPSKERHLQAEQYPNMAIDFRSNQNLIDFYDDYPVSFANNDPTTKWQFYVQAPLSETIRYHVYPKLSEILAGKTERDAVSMLLNFIQTAFVYEYDDKVWGCDRAFFPDETLFYPYCDCEDRAILFSRLVHDLTGLDVALVYYPGHLAAAVCFNETISGDYIQLEGKRYLICDPTYIYAPIGMTMPGMDNNVAKVILCNY